MTELRCTIKIYKFFWPEISTLLVDSLNYASFNGKLSNTQKKGVITLKEKKDEDRRLMKNWRSIKSLLNMDVTIGSNAITKRIERYSQISFIMIKVPLSRDELSLM